MYTKLNQRDIIFRHRNYKKIIAYLCMDLINEIRESSTQSSSKAVQNNLFFNLPDLLVANFLVFIRL